MAVTGAVQGLLSSFFLWVCKGLIKVQVASYAALTVVSLSMGYWIGSLRNSSSLGGPAVKTSSSSTTKNVTLSKPKKKTRTFVESEEDSEDEPNENVSDLRLDPGDEVKLVCRFCRDCPFEGMIGMR
jgi:uncharacterized cupredoxin-like copper-binding protein